MKLFCPPYPLSIWKTPSSPLKVISNITPENKVTPSRLPPLFFTAVYTTNLVVISLNCNCPFPAFIMAFNKFKEKFLVNLLLNKRWEYSFMHSFIHSLKIISSKHILHQNLILQENWQHYKNLKIGKTDQFLNSFCNIFSSIDLLFKEHTSWRNTKWRNSENPA